MAELGRSQSQWQLNDLKYRHELAKAYSIIDQRRLEATWTRSNDGGLVNGPGRDGRATAPEPQTLLRYLEMCHSLNLDIDVLPDRPNPTQGDCRSPAQRICPRKIIPWEGFAEAQEGIWKQLSLGSSFSHAAVFPSRDQLEAVGALLKPIGCELGLQRFQRHVVENALAKLVEEAYNDEALRNRLGIPGGITFETHPDLGGTRALHSKYMDLTSVYGDANTARWAERFIAFMSGRDTRRQGPCPDQCCIYRTSNDCNVPVLAIEYKAPNKLSCEDITTGLASDIDLNHDVIHNDGQGFQSTARRLASAVVSQLFFYMVEKGVQYGYVCTGEAFVFLHIPDDPSCVRYSVCVPNRDVKVGGENQLHRSAVAQVLAFTLQALRAPPPPADWRDAAQRLDMWYVKFDDVLKSIPAAIIPQRCATSQPLGFVYSPIRTPFQLPRSVPLQPSLGNGYYLNNFSSTVGQFNRPPGVSIVSRGIMPSIEGLDQQVPGQASPVSRRNIHDRPFCTHKCILGLSFCGPMDDDCPNFNDHGNEHLDPDEILGLIRNQLARDHHGQGTDCVPLTIPGSVGTLFKVRLASHGYTFVAKGVQSKDIAALRHEEEIYDSIHTLQGLYVPVCIGIVDLKQPKYYGGGKFMHFLFLTYAGRPICENLESISPPIINTVKYAFEELRERLIDHRHVKRHHILVHEGRAMLVNFRRADLYPRPLLPSSENGKRKRETM
ncbi:hypothetical protein BGZ61DRAFT_446118 [Ilyonectria robusta]|uniref:uncharacterized protein n=1 Tax=Ilyonectria robusta TaxID=1079257 RepID=UPI001E8D8396|nr:uncharacterized protein BGZ61DRAFT_446118 [Ilyonectria robusta]KAH8729292.1 hypothetical protein BGZ61DRAFT_446118 [Ilyonectria robusta]